MFKPVNTINNINTESYLRNLNKPLSRNATRQDFEKMKNVDNEMYKQNIKKINKCDPTNEINSNYTRLNLDNNYFKELTSNTSRYEIPLYNPQNNVYFGFNNT
jgi:hypothetical protein